MDALPVGTVLDITAHGHDVKSTFEIEKNVGKERLAQLVPRISRENADGHSIIAKPSHPDCSFVLLDDTSSEKLVSLTDTHGIVPRLVIKTSADSRQGLYTTSAKMDAIAHNVLFRELNTRWGDSRITGADHSFKLPSFAQRKPSRARIDGLGDWVNLELAQVPDAANNRDMSALVAVTEARISMERTDIETAQPVPGILPAITVQHGSRKPLKNDATAYERLKHIVTDKYNHAGYTFGADVDWSKIDYSVGKWMAKQPEVDIYGARHLMLACSPNIRVRHPGTDGERHIAKTL